MPEHPLSGMCEILDSRCLPGAYIATPRQIFDLCEVIRTEIRENFGLAGGLLGGILLEDSKTLRVRWLPLDQVCHAKLIREAPAP